MALDSTYTVDQKRSDCLTTIHEDNEKNVYEGKATKKANHTFTMDADVVKTPSTDSMDTHTTYFTAQDIVENREVKECLEFEDDLGPCTSNSMSTGSELETKANDNKIQIVDVGTGTSDTHQSSSGLSISADRSGATGFTSTPCNTLFENCGFLYDSNSELEETFPVSGEQKEEIEIIETPSSSVYSESYLGRADIFRPMLSNVERKMVGLSSIPDLSKVMSTHKSNVTPSGGGGDADHCCSEVENDETFYISPIKGAVGNTGAFKGMTSTSAVSDTESMGPGEHLSSFRNFRPKRKHVSFSDSEEMHTSRSANKTKTRHFRPWNTVQKVTTHLTPDKSSMMVFSPESQTRQLCWNADLLLRQKPLSPDMIKSKKLEGKLQQEIRIALFDYESQWAYEELKFRRQVQKLDLEYQKKLLNIVESHDTYQKKLSRTFQQRIRKTKQKLKKGAAHGQLNEGNCFNILQSISGIKLDD